MTLRVGGGVHWVRCGPGIIGMPLAEAVAQLWDGPAWLLGAEEGFGGPAC